MTRWISLLLLVGVAFAGAAQAYAGTPVPVELHETTPSAEPGDAEEATLDAVADEASDGSRSAALDAQRARSNRRPPPALRPPR